MFKEPNVISLDELINLLCQVFRIAKYLWLALLTVTLLLKTRATKRDPSYLSLVYVMPMLFLQNQS